MQKIIDKLSYNLLYAPDYPAEDKTNLEREERQILNWLDDVLESTKREDVGDWIRMSVAAVRLAFESFASKDERKGRSAIQDSLEYLRNAKGRKPHAADFIAGAGTVKKVEK